MIHIFKVDENWKPVEYLGWVRENYMDFIRNRKSGRYVAIDFVRDYSVTATSHTDYTSWGKTYPVSRWKGFREFMPKNYRTERILASKFYS